MLIALLIHLFLAQATRVEGYSMEPTLYGHQRLVIEKLSYHLHPPERDDIVVLRVPGFGPEMLIKRVIGLPGETVEVRDGQVMINGQPLPEPYLRTITRGLIPKHAFPKAMCSSWATTATIPMILVPLAPSRSTNWWAAPGCATGLLQMWVWCTDRPRPRSIQRFEVVPHR